jgi:hypothetical protein
MTTTTVDVFAQTGYSVTTRMVDRVDNQGEPCEVCQEEPHYIDATVYGVTNDGILELDHRTTIDCCIYCIPAVIRTLDPTTDVTVELGDSANNDRMHGQDCDCVHPDGA